MKKEKSHSKEKVLKVYQVNSHEREMSHNWTS